MNFFSLHPSLEEAIQDLSNQTRLRLEIECGTASLDIHAEEIVSARFESGFDAPGCIISRGEVVFETPGSEWDWGAAGQVVKVFFTCGDCEYWLHRFTFYPDARGFRTSRTGGQQENTTVSLEDAAARMKWQGALRDWREKEVVIDGVFADKADPENSLLHRIAARGGVATDEIDCCTVPLTLPYAELSKSPWEELCDLTVASLTFLEAGTDKKLIFSQSAYQEEGSEPEIAYPMEESLFYSLESEDAGDDMYNDIRLRWNKPERLERQELWRYGDPPVEYDEQLTPLYRFLVAGEKRAIEEAGGIQAHYRVPAEGFENSPVVWADEVDDLTTVEAAMVCDGPGLAVSLLDTESYSDRAVIGVSCSADVILRELVICGQPVVMRLNASCYRRDEDAIDEWGLRVLNATGRYFSDSLVGGVAHYEDWVERQLENLKGMRRRIIGETEYGVFHSRVGALAEIDDESYRVESIKLGYSKRTGFFVRVVFSNE